VKTLSDLANLKFEASKMVSDQARNLALAGLAIVWLFAGPFFVGESGQKPEAVLFWAGAALAGALALDLAQLVARTVVLQVIYVRRRDAASDDDDDPVVEDYGPLNWITGLLFYAKIAALSLGYLCILAYFIQAATK
jgi:hypothetical protein